MTRLSKQIAVALRHKPWQFELELDAEGWAPVEQLLDALRDRREWREITRAELEALVAAQGKPRYELRGERIRALYGHSLPGKIEHAAVQPPAVLYHGTARRFLAQIMADGLRPMRRQYVHLSPSVEIARLVGQRRDAEPVILRVDAAEAAAAGIAFYAGNGEVFLADYVPPGFLALETDRPHPAGQQERR
jgi:putative RNA 2'-phosphotransferase